jgi:D-alanyl-lipoteichoic acid acyltransferase DltB (MBOAT superfamily)
MAFIPVYILILFFTIIIDYSAGIFIEESEGTRRRFFFYISVVSTVGVLFVFKYFNFFNANIAGLAKFLDWSYSYEGLMLALPLGLSFHTFQSLSYVIEVYRGNQKAEKNFGIYSLYVMFYPQLVAGPIERPQNLLKQFYQSHSFDYDRVTDGLKLMAWGLFKKVVIADRLAVFVNNVYNNPHAFEGVPLILATVFFAFQIYCDFSGYSDIAIGAAQVMGFRLMQNFERPYLSKSIAEFWKRWHISLSTWFRDYFYIPLGGNRVPVNRWYLNLFLTFLISGLWHGANWTFVFWGALNGFYLIFAIVTANARNRFTHAIGLQRYPRVHKGVKVLSTFALICFAWIFFRANSIEDAFYIVTHLFNGVADFIWNYAEYLIAAHINSGPKPDKSIREVLAMGKNMGEFRTALKLIVLLVIVQLIQRKGVIRQRISSRPVLLRWSAYYLFVLALIMYGLQSSEKFIYFQF